MDEVLMPMHRAWLTACSDSQGSKVTEMNKQLCRRTLCQVCGNTVYSNSRVLVMMYFVCTPLYRAPHCTMNAIVLCIPLYRAVNTRCGCANKLCSVALRAPSGIAGPADHPARRHDQPACHHDQPACHHDRPAPCLPCALTAQHKGSAKGKARGRDQDRGLGHRPACEVYAVFATALVARPKAILELLGCVKHL
eukprot:1155672-Pelagomonas_calceolata.AAC.10